MGSAAWTDVPGASVSIGTSNDYLVLDAMFTAESLCNGATGWCSLRILARSPNGVDTELPPAAGDNFAFDSAGGESYQAGAMKRTSTMFFDVQPPTGATWTVRVQAKVMAGASSFWLDDWNLTVLNATPFPYPG